MVQTPETLPPSATSIRLGEFLFISARMASVVVAQEVVIGLVNVCICSEGASREEEEPDVLAALPLLAFSPHFEC